MSARLKVLVTLAAAGAILLSASSAFADDTGTVATAKKQTRLMSITISPLQLAYPIVEVTGEFKANDDWGLALIGGAGSIKTDASGSLVVGDSSETLNTWDVWEVGGQFRYYAVGDFDHGMQLGVETLYVNVSNSDVDSGDGTSVSASAQGLSVGAFVGYKIATDLGFTFDGQLGYQRTGVGASAQDNNSDASAEGESSGWGPLLNLNVGWSF